jgi:hypothetical protein
MRCRVLVTSLTGESVPGDGGTTGLAIELIAAIVFKIPPLVFLQLITPAPLPAAVAGFAVW